MLIPSFTIKILILFRYDNSYKDYIKNKHWTDFLDKKQNYSSFARAKSCNFFEQSTCLTTLQKKIDDTELSENCLPKCFHNTHVQQGVFVSER